MRGRLGAVVCAAMLVAACGAPADSGSAGGVSGTLVVNGAGTLARPFEDVIAAFEKRNPDVTVRSRFAGSVEIVRRVTDLGAPVDVVGVADYSLIPAEMFGEDHFADWYVGFAANRITFAYTDRSKGAANCKQQAPRKPIPAVAGKGSITWVPVAGQLFPCKLDMKVGLAFDDTKATEMMESAGIPVQGCM